MSVLLVVGLGNPGDKYALDRHNVGFWLIDMLAEQLQIPFKLKKAFHAELAEGTYLGQKIILVKPQTFMNNSGLAVLQVQRFFKLATEHILVLHDELDFEVGKLRLKYAGGHGGHNGLRDIHHHLASDAYWRCRIGIGRPVDSKQVTSYVLQPPKTTDKQAILTALAAFLTIWDRIVEQDFEAAMLQLHSSI